MLTGVLAFSQSRVVTGRVTEKDGNPVPFATVNEPNTKNSVNADANGSFSIKIKTGVTNLNITASGYKPNQFLIAGNTAVGNIEKLDKNLETVTVTTSALGIKRNPKQFGGAATTISNKVLTQAKSVNIQQALNGKVSGINISTTNSGVFENSKINIRGIRSLTGNNQPLLVVDGSPTPLTFLSSIAPDDVQDLTVLKSAASAAIYGQDGVNGVIVINTKRGLAGTKPTVTFTTTFQDQSVSFFPRMQSRFGTGTGEKDIYGNMLYTPYENQNFGPEYDGSTRILGVTLEDGSKQFAKYSPDYINDKVQFWNTGYVLQNTLSMIGQDFYLSISDANIKGLTPKDVNRRTSFRFNGNKSYGKFSAGYGLTYTLSKYNIFNENGLASSRPSAFTGGLFDQIIQIAAHVPLLSYSDWRNDKFSQYSNFYNEYSVNPYYAIDNYRTDGKNDDIIGNLDFGYQLAPWLKANLKVATNLTFQRAESNSYALTVSDYAKANRASTTYSDLTSSVSTNQTTNTRLNIDYFFTGDNKVSKSLGVKYLLGGMLRQNKNSDISIGGNNLVVPNLFNVSARSGEPSVPLPFTGNYTITNRTLSTYGSLAFNYNNWLNVEFTARNDWDSRLAKNNQSFFYPGVNAAFILSDAIPSLKGNFLDFLKVRGAVSKSGNVNIGTYALQSTYSQPTGFPFGAVSGYTANNTIPSSDLKPEFVNTKEVGFEVGFLKSKVTLEGTYFNQNNTNQILNVTQSITTGYTTSLKNAADFINQGVELDLGLTPLLNLGKKTKLDLKVNATYNENRVTRTDNDLPVILNGTGTFTSAFAGSPTVNNIAQVGSAAFAYQLTDYKRDPATGKVIVDANGNPDQASELAVKGRSLPKWIIGLTPTLTMGNITFSMTWDFKTGHNFYAGIGPGLDNAGISEASAQYGRQRFVFPNSVYLEGGKYVDNVNRQVSDGNYDFWSTNKTSWTQIGTNYFASATALRLRELSLSYNLPATVLGNSVIKKLTFSVIGRNLFLLVPKSNAWSDPEFNSATGSNTFGISSSFQTPTSRLIGASLTAQF
jgi:TonB-linked SusC/RagA family outer membrane protein